MCELETVWLRCENKAAANKGLAIAGGQWLIEVLCFYFTFVLADSLVLRNARHRQAPKRYRKPYDDHANIKLTDMKRTILDNITERLTARPTSQRNEVLFFATAHFLFFNFSATAHCSHLFCLQTHQPTLRQKHKRAIPTAPQRAYSDLFILSPILQSC